MAEGDSSKAASGGISFGGMLAILFIGLKLTGYITWPWLWVLAPLWIPIAIALGFLAVVLVFLASIFLIATVVEYVRSR